MEDSTNFAFCFNGETEAHPSLSADVLFDGGKIRPLKLLTRSEYVRYSPDQSPRSPKRMLTKSVLVSPRRHNQKSTDSPLLITPAKKQQHGLSSYFTADSKLVSEPTLEKQTCKDTTCSSFFSSNSSSSSSSTNRSIIWKLLDLLMMCGCSENVANKVDESASIMRSSYKKDTNDWSFRSDNSSSKSTRGGSSRKGSTASVSAHEWHYKKKREAAEEMRRKTFLPYKKNLLGCMDHVDVDTGTVLEFYRGQRVVEITC